MYFQAAGIDVEGISTDSLLTDVCPWSVPVPVVRFDLTKFKKAETNPEQYKQLFLELSSSYPNHSKSLLMVLNAMKKLLLQRLQIATLKVPHYVGSLTVALFILLNCMPFTLPLGSSASLRKSPSWCCLILCLF